MKAILFGLKYTSGSSYSKLLNKLNDSNYDEMGTKVRIRFFGLQGKLYSESPSPDSFPELREGFHRYLSLDWQEHKEIYYKSSSAGFCFPLFLYQQ